MQTHQSYQNIIYLSMLVIKESDNIYTEIKTIVMWDGNQCCIKMYGEVYNQLSLSVDMHLRETNTSSHKLQLCSLCSPMTWAKWSTQLHNNTSIVLPLNHRHELVFIRLNG